MTTGTTTEEPTMSTVEHITEATIEAHPTLPQVLITRDFHASRESVFRAHVEQALVEKWLGPDRTEMAFERWEGVTGGGYRYTASVGSEMVASFFGSFHEVRSPERIVQTFTWEGMPDGVSLETLTLTDLGDGWTRLSSTATLESLEARDGMLASGMEVGVNEGYAKLDGLLPKA